MQSSSLSCLRRLRDHRGIGVGFPDTAHGVGRGENRASLREVPESKEGRSDIAALTRGTVKTEDEPVGVIVVVTGGSAQRVRALRAAALHHVIPILEHAHLAAARGLLFSATRCAARAGSGRAAANTIDARTADSRGTAATRTAARPTAAATHPAAGCAAHGRTAGTADVARARRARLSPRARSRAALRCTIAAVLAGAAAEAESKAKPHRSVQKRTTLVA